MEDNSLIRIAYADDHKLIREAIVTTINSFRGVVVDVEADNGRDLISKIEKSDTLPDICILDLSMPKMNGFETIDILKSKWPEIRVLVLTMFDLEFYKIKTIISGANGYLLKNCMPKELQEAIFAIFNEGIYYSDAVNKQFFHSIKNRKVNLPNLTDSELLVLKYSCNGDLSYSDIAKQIGTTTRSVEGIRDSLFKKFHTHSRVNIVTLAIQFGIVNIEPTKIDYKDIFKNKQVKR